MPRRARLRRFGLACLLLSTLPGVVVAQYRPDDAVRQRRRVLAAKPVIPLGDPYNRQPVAACELFDLVRMRGVHLTTIMLQPLA